MAEKKPAHELRQMRIKDIQRFINDQEKKKRKIFAETPSTSNPEQPSESMGTVKKNIARAKTILNEKTTSQRPA